MENKELNYQLVVKTDLLKCKYNIGESISHKEYGEGKICSVETKKRGSQYSTIYGVAFKKSGYINIKEEELEDL